MKLARPRPLTVLIAGIVASVAYLAAEAIDERVAPNPYSDLRLWGGMFTADPRRQKAIGLAIHFTLGIGVAGAYEAVLPSLPPLPAPLRGILFAEAENTIFYPAVPVLNAIHREVRAGRMASLLTWRYFLLEMWRHAAFGAVLGVAESALPSSRKRSGRT